MLAAVIDGMNESGALERRRRRRGRRSTSGQRRQGRRDGNRNGSNMAQPARADRAVLGRRRPAADDAPPGPRPGGDRRGRQRGAARALRRQVGGDGDHRARGRLGLGGDPHHGRARRGDREYVLNGEKIFVTSGDRAELIVVWATLDRAQGRAAIKSFVVERDNPGPEARPARAQARDPRLGHRQLRARRLPGAEGEPARQPRDRAQARLRRGDADVRQHPPARRRHGDRRRRGRAWSARASSWPRRGSRSTTTPRRHSQSRGRGRVHRDGGRLGGGAAADPAGGVDGRQPQAQLAPGVDGQGQGGPHGYRRRAALRRAVRRRSATARASCWRSGPATSRSSTCSRAPSRSSC